MWIRLSGRYGAGLKVNGVRSSLGFRAQGFTLSGRGCAGMALHSDLSEIHFLSRLCLLNKPETPHILNRFIPNFSLWRITVEGALGSWMYIMWGLCLKWRLV